MQSESLTQRASTTRILFDKLWEPWNTHHYADLPGTPTCLSCDGTDSLQHLLIECPQGRSIREELDIGVQKLIQEVESDIAKETIRTIYTMATCPEGSPIMLGLWQPHHAADFSLRISANHPNPSTQQTKDAAAAIITVTRLLTTSAQALIRQRIKQTRDRKRPLGPRLHPEHQEPIWTQFLTNKKKATTKKRKKKPKPPKPPSPALIAARARTDREAEIRARTQAMVYADPIPQPPPTPPRQPQPWETEVPLLPPNERWAAQIENQLQRHLAYQRYLRPPPPGPPLTKSSARQQKPWQHGLPPPTAASEQESSPTTRTSPASPTEP